VIPGLWQRTVIKKIIHNIEQWVPTGSCVAPDGSGNICIDMFAPMKGYDMPTGSCAAPDGSLVSDKVRDSRTLELV
jgi:hypothetical protein